MAILWFVFAALSTYCHFQGVQMHWTALPAAQVSAGIFLLMLEAKNK